MEDEFKKDLLKREKKGRIKEELEEDLNKINLAKENIKKLEKEEPSAYVKGSIKIELKKILEVLPEEINVLHFKKEIYVSRAKEEDTLIRVWRMEDLEDYTLGLEENLVFQDSDITFPRRWK